MRSRAVVYVAVALTILALFALVVLVSSSASNVNRLGLLLQLLGSAALLPDIFGKEKLRWLSPKAPPQAPTTGTQPADPDPGPEPVPPVKPPEGESWFNYYQVHNRSIVLGNILASLWLMWLLVEIVLNPTIEHFADENVLRATLSFLGFIWINIFMLIQISRLSQSALTDGLLAWFFSVDLLVGIPGMVFGAAVHIVVNWMGRGLKFVFSNGIRRVLLVITLPSFVIGLAFELLATFMH